nr:MAG TPA: hypothetical protein [Caudoviricetes sp.]
MHRRYYYRRSVAIRYRAKPADKQSLQYDILRTV